MVKTQPQMTYSKELKRTKLSFVDTKTNIPKKQVILFGALISATASAIGLGYALYVSSPLAQESFIKFANLIL